MLNCTELIFCGETVDSDLVTRTLELQPTLSYKVGDVIDAGQIERLAAVGMWKLCLPEVQAIETVEEQLARWVTLLRSKGGRMSNLRQIGYSPYIDCQAESGYLSLCVDSDVLAGLGALGIALSVWLYEAPTTGL